ncbi:MAG: hypothetical protein NC321_10495 [Clostridium sp.]|nr:hypothetical protein [Clostridium sp.]
MSDGGKGCLISDNLRTDEVVAHKLGIGGKDTYRKEKYIVDNKNSLSPEDFADWDNSNFVKERFNTKEYVNKHCYC